MRMIELKPAIMQIHILLIPLMTHLMIRMISTIWAQGPGGTKLIGIPLFTNFPPLLIVQIISLRHSMKAGYLWIQFMMQVIGGMITLNVFLLMITVPGYISRHLKITCLTMVTFIAQLLKMQIKDV